MDLLSRIVTWLGENEATISAVVGITVLAGVVFAGLRSLVRRRGETSQEKAPSWQPPSPLRQRIPQPADLDPLTVPGFEGRPAIAVLPFDNLSGDPEQEYFADGIAEDLITRLSAWRDFPVIARNSSFTYKGKAVDVKQVSRELGVRYVVEGSVRKVGDRVRISAQLIDATTGAHVWAETYDRELRDIFALQDEITEAIVASMHPELLRCREEARWRTGASRTSTPGIAYCAAWWHFSNGTRRMTTRRPGRSSRRPLELIHSSPMPSLVLAIDALRGHSAPVDAIRRLESVSPQSRPYSARMRHWTMMIRACNALWAMPHRLTGQHDEAIAAFERAVQLEPELRSRATRDLGLTLALHGQAGRGHREPRKGDAPQPQRSRDARGSCSAAWRWRTSPPGDTRKRSTGRSGASSANPD